MDYESILKQLFEYAVAHNNLKNVLVSVKQLYGGKEYQEFSVVVSARDYVDHNMMVQAHRNLENLVTELFIHRNIIIQLEAPF